MTRQEKLAKFKESRNAKSIGDYLNTKMSIIKISFCEQDITDRDTGEVNKMFVTTFSTSTDSYRTTSKVIYDIAHELVEVLETADFNDEPIDVKFTKVGKYYSLELV